MGDLGGHRTEAITLWAWSPGSPIPGVWAELGGDPQATAETQVALPLALGAQEAHEDTATGLSQSPRLGANDPTL